MLAGGWNPAKHGVPAGTSGCGLNDEQYGDAENRLAAVRRIG